MKDQSSNKHLIYRASIAGITHSNAMFHESDMREGAMLELRAVDGNSFDADAVELRFDGDRIGWLQNKDPRMSGMKKVIRKLIEAEVDLRCLIVRVDPKMMPENRYMIGIWIITGE